MIYGLILFPFRFFLLGSGSLAHAGYALIVDHCPLRRIVVQGRLQALADGAWLRPFAQGLLFADVFDHVEEATVAIELVALVAGPGDLPMGLHGVELLRERTRKVVAVNPLPLLAFFP